MALAALEALAFVGTVITTIPVLQDFISPKPDIDKTTVVKIVAGDDDFTDGNLPGIHLFDRSGNTVGIHASAPDFDEKLGKGEIRTVNIEQIDRDISAAGTEYISLSHGGNDAICVSFITVRTPTGNQYSFTGDIAFECVEQGVGIFWYHGNVVISQGEKGIVEPKCFWLDGDATNGINTKGVGIHLPSFIPSKGREASFKESPNRQCHSEPRFAAYADDGFGPFSMIPFFKEDVFDLGTLEDFDDKALDQNNWGLNELDIPFFKRGLAGPNSTAESDTTPLAREGGGPPRNNAGGDRPSRSWRKPGQLIKCASESKSARALCESETSHGPDFLNTAEGLLCDMDTKNLWDVCKDEQQTGCFDAERSRMRLGRGNNRRDESSGRLIPRKVYDDVKQW